MTPDVYDVIRTGPTLLNAQTRKWLLPQDITACTAIFIHGFTSHGRYMSDLADYACGNGLVTALFNYDSYAGIDKGAASLLDRLEPMTEILKKDGYVLVAHSMGGLVALYCASGIPSTLLDSLRGIVLLGVPNSGTLFNRKVISHMLDWADALTGPNPYARSVGCRASLQLTGNDEERLLASLALKVRDLKIPIASFSGGMSYLDFGSGQWAGRVRNKVLQRLIAEVPNDGLVPESSSNVLSALGIKQALHLNEYADYSKINHTFLNRNQQIANLIMMWLHKNVLVPAQAS